MKKLMAFGLILALPLLAAADTFTPQVDPGTTNTVLVDCRKKTSLTAEAAGFGTNYYTVILGVTAWPTNNGSQNFGIAFEGTNTLYTWTNIAGLTNGVLASPRTRVSFGAVANDDGTASNALQIVLNLVTNTFVITNAAGPGQIPAGSTNAGSLATNIAAFLTATYPSFTVAQASSNQLTITTLTNDLLTFGQVGSDFTNTSATVYLSTNIAPTNLFYVVPGTNIATSAQALQAVLQRDFPSIRTTLASSNILTLSTYGLTLGETNSAGWSTNQVTTNAAFGTISLTAAGSADFISWVPQPQFNLTLQITNTGAAAITNGLLYGMPFLQYTIINVATNGAMPGFRLTTSAF